MVQGETAAHSIAAAYPVSIWRLSWRLSCLCWSIWSIWSRLRPGTRLCDRLLQALKRLAFYALGNQGLCGASAGYLLSQSSHKTWLNHGSRTAAGPSLPVQPSFVQEISGKHQQMLKRKMTSGFTQDIGYARAARVMAFGSLVCWSVSICVAEHCRTGTYPVHWQNKPLVLLAAFVKGKFSNNCVKQIGYVNRFTMLNNFALWCRCLSLGPPKIEVAWKQR